MFVTLDLGSGSTFSAPLKYVLHNLPASKRPVPAPAQKVDILPPSAKTTKRPVTTPRNKDVNTDFNVTTPAQKVDILPHSAKTTKRFVTPPTNNDVDTHFKPAHMDNLMDLRCPNHLHGCNFVAKETNSLKSLTAHGRACRYKTDDSDLDEDYLDTDGCLAAVVEEQTPSTQKKEAQAAYFKSIKEDREEAALNGINKSTPESTAFYGTAATSVNGWRNSNHDNDLNSNRDDGSDAQDDCEANDIEKIDDVFDLSKHRKQSGGIAFQTRQQFDFQQSENRKLQEESRRQQDEIAKLKQERKNWRQEKHNAEIQKQQQQQQQEKEQRRSAHDTPKFTAPISQNWYVTTLMHFYHASNCVTIKGSATRDSKMDRPTLSRRIGMSLSFVIMFTCVFALQSIKGSATRDSKMNRPTLSHRIGMSLSFVIMLTCVFALQSTIN